jgi:hypothetical protein
MTVATYGQTYNTYPVYTSEDGLSYEGAMKRFKTMPTPDDVFRKALLGLPKKLPMTNEELIPEDAAPFLEAAITEIEMSTCMNITPVDHFQSFDYIDGMFEANFMGMNLERWPTTKINRLNLKYPHTQTITNIPGVQSPSASGVAGTYQTYTIPSGWVALRRNKINVVAAFGAVTVSTDASAIANAGGIFSYITGFGRGAYQPAMIECWYTAGFPPDKLPATIWDLIVTLATIRFLEDIFAVLLPYSNVNVSIDGVSQSASLNLAQMLLQRITSLKEQYDKKKAAINQNFGKTIKLSFIGA